MALERDRFMVVTTLQNKVQEQLCIFSRSFSLTKSCLCHKLLQQEITVAIVNSIRTLVIMAYRCLQCNTVSWDTQEDMTCVRATDIE